MSATAAKIGGILSEPRFVYKLLRWGDLIYGTPEQLRRIGIGLDIHFPGHDDGRWRRICVDPRGFKVDLHFNSVDGGGIFVASITFPGRQFDVGAVAKQFAPGVELREETHGDVYTGTADALVAAGIVPAGHFPGWPGMLKTTVNIKPDGSMERFCKMARAPGGRYIQQISKGQRPTYRVAVGVSSEIEEAREEGAQRLRGEWELRMDALPRPAPLIDLPGFRASPKIKMTPKYRTEGNVITLAPRSEWMAQA